MTKTVPEKVERQARKLGVVDSAIPDVLMRFDVEGVGARLPATKPGKVIRNWLGAQKQLRPQWWPADGAEPEVRIKKSTPNPFDYSRGWNTTEQARLYRANPKLCDALAKKVGGFIGMTEKQARQIAERRKLAG